MIALWMLYMTIVGLLLAAAAHAVEQLVVARGWPRRFVWLTAILALPLIPLLPSALRPALSVSAVPTRMAATPATPATATATPGDAAVSGFPLSPTHTSALDPIRFGKSLVAAWSALDLGAIPVVAVLRARAYLPYLARFDDWLTFAWILITVVLLVGYIGAAITLANQRQRWPSTRIDGDTVLVAPDVGPAVVGTLRPSIVLPAWSLALERPVRALILTHEREHLRARDPLFLHFATVAVYLLPWNLAVWWMLQRLRVAIEVDCDRRVLRTGCDARHYANLLLAVGSRRSLTHRILAPALVERRSILARRIIAMYPGRSKFRYLRLALSAGAAYALLAAAYTTPIPALAQLEVPSTKHGESPDLPFDDVDGLVALKDASSIALAPEGNHEKGHRVRSKLSRRGLAVPRPTRRPFAVESLDGAVAVLITATSGRGVRPVLISVDSTSRFGITDLPNIQGSVSMPDSAYPTLLRGTGSVEKLLRLAAVATAIDSAVVITSCGRVEFQVATPTSRSGDLELPQKGTTVDLTIGDNRVTPSMPIALAPRDSIIEILGFYSNPEAESQC